MRLGVTHYVDCAHLLPGHPKCGQLHGHTYRVEVVVEGEMKDGMVLDFADLKARIRAVLARYDHRHWNDRLENPTAEWISVWIWDQLKPALPGLTALEMFEVEGASCWYRGEHSTGERAS
jgi:6-pyruvoyltetrahydropterin/6-carboxytetrahydropterin synthase